MKFAHQSATIRQHGKGMIILETALETAGLTYVFPDGNGIKNIAFQVKRGEIYALYGGHHAGKSVLLQTIIGTLRPQAGTLKLFGNIDYQKERRRIGFVPQKPVTIGSLSPADMLRYFSSVFGTTEIHILDILHLNLKEKKAVRRLPLSTQRLVNLAVALLGNPDMIILDDPFSGLDKGECEHLLSVLNYLHEINHTTLLISGQDYTLLSRLASKYGVMADGKLLCELTAGELKKSCQRCIKIRTPQLERAITILSQQFPDFEVLGHDLIRIFHCNEQSGEINTLLVHSGIEVSEIWLAGMEPTDYLLKMTGGAKSDSDDAKGVVPYPQKPPVLGLPRIGCVFCLCACLDLLSQFGKWYASGYITGFVHGVSVFRLQSDFSIDALFVPVLYRRFSYRHIQYHTF